MSLVPRRPWTQLPAGVVAELGDGAACSELVARVVRRHGRRLVAWELVGVTGTILRGQARRANRPGSCGRGVSYVKKQQRARKRGRPARVMPPPIPATTEDRARAITPAPPKKKPRVMIALLNVAIQLPLLILAAYVTAHFTVREAAK